MYTSSIQSFTIRCWAGWFEFYPVEDTFSHDVAHIWAAAYIKCPDQPYMNRCVYLPRPASLPSVYLWYRSGPQTTVDHPAYRPYATEHSDPWFVRAQSICNYLFVLIWDIPDQWIRNKSLIRDLHLLLCKNRFLCWAVLQSHSTIFALLALKLPYGWAVCAPYWLQVQVQVGARFFLKLDFLHTHFSIVLIWQTTTIALVDNHGCL